MSRNSLPIRSSQGHRRPVRVALAAGLVAALAVTGLHPALADENSPSPLDKPLDDKFGTADATRLAEAKESGEAHVTLLIAADPSATSQVAEHLGKVPGASIGFTDDSVGYVRTTVLTDAADLLIDEARALESVYAIDLNEEIVVPDPTPGTDSAQRMASSESYHAPGKSTPAKNPYQPSHEIGTVDFIKKNPKADGRGITIGVLDTGVDLDHPALRETTTGERKIIDSVTATDPIIDSDQTWRPMLTEVSGERFEFNDREYHSPEGEHLVALFEESATSGGDMDGDLDRDGSTTGSWAVLYDAEAGTVTVDLDDDGDFRNDTPMRPYGESHDIGYFGEDDPDTAVAERIPFVVEIREGVPLDPYGDDWAGQTADFVNIGVVSGAHGTHVAGITAANGLFGGAMNGAAPGAQVVSSRACSFGGGCTATALTEGMIDLVVNRGVDLVNMSIGGLPALNDGNNARARLYSELIDTYGVQLFISAGNEGPGVNTVGDPSVADKVVSVGAGVSRDTWAANYGSKVSKKYHMMPFSSRGPREDGGFKPTIVGPGASVNTIPTWQDGNPVPEAGYELPPGYGMLQGTSMSSPQVAGASALLLSAAKTQGIGLSPADLRTALTSSAEQIKGVQAHEQGAGLMDTGAAWKLLTKGATAHEYSVRAPVDTTLSEFLATPHSGAGVYDRESAPEVGEFEDYEVTVIRTSGPEGLVKHQLKLVNNHDKTFRITSKRNVSLPLNEPVTVSLRAAPSSPGVHSAILAVDDKKTKGTDHQILNTIIVPGELVAPSHAVEHSGTVQRNDTTSYFVTVPEGAQTLEVGLSGLEEGSQTRWIAITPWGVPTDPSSTVNCYPNFDNPADTCQPELRAYEDPTPGVWELEVESRRTSPVLDNPYTLSAAALGASFDPATVTIEEAQTGTPVPVDWEVTNAYAAVMGGLEGGELGSSLTDRPTISDGEYQRFTVEIDEDVSRLEAVIGSPADNSADLDLTVYHDGAVVGSSATGGSEEAVSVSDPEPGSYTVEVHAYSVPAGTTEYDYRDVFFSPAFGQVTVDEERTITLAPGERASIDAEVMVEAKAPQGREFFGEVRLVNERGTVAGTGSVRIERVVLP